MSDNNMNEFSPIPKNVTESPTQPTISRRNLLVATAFGILGSRISSPERASAENNVSPVALLTEFESYLPNAIYEKKEQILELIPDIEIVTEGPLNVSEDNPEGDKEVGFNPLLSQDEAMARAKLVYAGSLIRIMHQYESFKNEDGSIDITSLNDFMESGQFPGEPDWELGVDKLLNTPGLLIPIMAVKTGEVHRETKIVDGYIDPTEKLKVVFTNEEQVYTTYDSNKFSDIQEIGQTYCTDEKNALTVYNRVKHPIPNKEAREQMYAGLLVSGMVPLEMTLGTVNSKQINLYNANAESYGDSDETVHRFIYSDVTRPEYKLVYGTDPFTPGAKLVPLLTVL